MPAPSRLILRIPLHFDQAKALAHIMNSEGLCACGRFMKVTDGKFVLGNLRTTEDPVIANRNTIILGAYCYECSTLINNALKFIKGRHAGPAAKDNRDSKGV